MYRMIYFFFKKNKAILRWCVNKKKKIDKMHNKTANSNVLGNRITSNL